MTFIYDGNWVYCTETGQELNFGPGLRGYAPPHRDRYGREILDRLPWIFRMQNWITPFGLQARGRWFYPGKGLRR